MPGIDQVQLDNLFQNNQLVGFLDSRATMQVIAGSVVAEIAGSVVALPNTAYASGTEAGWKTYATIKFVRDFANDPALILFGEYLYAADVLREQLVNFYNELGVDPAKGMQVVTSMLRDHRSDRLDLYRAHERFTSEPRNHTAFAHVQGVRSVGQANVGLVRFDADGADIRSVQHELLWYVAAAELGADHQEVSVQLPRTDWLGTLHEAAWIDVRHDLGKS
jgi:hypothetical protein